MPWRLLSGNDPFVRTKTKTGMTTGKKKEMAAEKTL